jgi:hypothetical protein
MTNLGLNIHSDMLCDIARKTDSGSRANLHKHGMLLVSPMRQPTLALTFLLHRDDNLDASMVVFIFLAAWNEDSDCQMERTHSRITGVDLQHC